MRRLIEGGHIRRVRAMTDEECSYLGWPTGGRDPVVLEVEIPTGDVVVIFPMRDEEGNGPGTLMADVPTSGVSFLVSAS